ncbi:MAG: hypothetical protein ACI4F1_01940 [Bariatricus sp.]
MISKLRDEPKITLNAWFATWMEEYKKNQVKRGTYTNYQNYYKCAIEERLGGKPGLPMAKLANVF